MAANRAEMRKITSLARKVFTPMDSAISWPPLRARMARPKRESRRFRVISMAHSKTAQIR
ncbi:hypothetical protein D3C86_2194000 [compost metagenome]